MKTASTATPTSKIRTSRRGFVALALLLTASALVGSCAHVQSPASSVQSPAESRSPGVQQASKPIVILVSLDGWRWDYFERAQVPRLRALARAGVRSEGLIPPFPSKTFPSHYSIVTGLYPE